MHGPGVAAALAAAVLLAPAGAGAGPVAASEPQQERQPPRPGVSVESNHVSKIIFLNRCAGGCTIYPGWDDARDDHSSIASEVSQISEFQHGDQVWDAIVQCVKELYAPYDLTVTDVDPGENVFHHEAIVAGTWDEVYHSPAGGVAPSICHPNNNVISFTFANGWPANAIRICEIIGQESAHSYGLEHAYDCSDPLTYLPRCGRQFFRDRVTPCGEYAEADCYCGGTAQNSHRWLRTVLGANPIPVPGPEVEIVAPSAGAQVASGFSVAATALHMRGIGRVELHVNGTEYARVDGHPYTSAGEAYWLETPADLADGVLDLEVRAYNDLGSETIAALTVTKGSPCGAAADCNPGQECADGRCFFPPATGQLGDACTDPAECISGVCPQGTEQGYCSESCFPSTTDPTCPAGWSCVEVAVNEGVCWPAEGEPGCGCGARRGPGGGAVLFAIAIAAVVGRRRRCPG